MKKIIFLSLFISIAFFISINHVSATSGGPFYVYNLKYNPTDTSLYYTEYSESGRGCPPVLKKISLTSLQVSDVLSCDQVEQLSRTDASDEINGIISDFKNLEQINLTRNNIKIELVNPQVKKLPNEDWVMKTILTARVYQDEALISEFPISGCSADQPFLFGGYGVTSLNKKIVLLLSTKGDCFEGGYIYETLHIINGTIKVRGTLLSEPVKFAVPLKESGSTITATYKKDTTPVSTPSQVAPSTETAPISVTPENTQVTPQDKIVDKDSSNKEITIALIAAGFLILGIALGYGINRK